MVTPWNGWQVLHEEESQSEKKRQDMFNEAIQEEEFWVPLENWLVKGIHKYKEQVTDSDLLMFVKEHEGETPPPETFYTNQKAKFEIDSILSRRGITHKRLDEMIKEYRQAKEQGIISAEEWEKYAAQLEDIRSRHTARLEECVQWFMDNYYRVFDEKLHVVTKIKLTNTRLWKNDRETEFKQVLDFPCQIPQKRPFR